MDFDLRRLPVFASLQEGHVRLLEALIEKITCRPGELIIRQDSPADYFYIILRGKVEIFFKPYDGMPITITHLEEGGLFGWSAVIGSGKYTSSARAIADVKAISILGRDLRKLSVEHPEAGSEILNKLASAVSSRWKDAHEQVKAILSQGLKNGNNSQMD